MATKAKAAPAKSSAKSPTRKAKVTSQVGSEIELELVKASGIDPQGDDEDRVEFLRRVAEGVNDNVSEEDYDGLSDGAKEWFGTVVDLIDKKNKPMFEFPDAEEQEPAGEPEEVKPAKGTKPGAAKGKAAPAAKGKAKAKSDGDARPQGEGYAGHRPGTKAEKAHKLMDEMLKKGKDRAAVLEAWDKLEISDATKNTWFQKFKNW